MPPHVPPHVAPSFLVAANAQDSTQYKKMEEEETDEQPEGRVTTGWMDSASRYLYGKKQPERPSGSQTHHEGPLLKKGGKGLSPFAAEYRSRYFVMLGPKLYYFNSWEDYGSQVTFTYRPHNGHITVTTGRTTGPRYAHVLQIALPVTAVTA